MRNQIECEWFVHLIEKYSLKSILPDLGYSIGYLDEIIIISLFQNYSVYMQDGEESDKIDWKSEWSSLK